MAEMSGKVVLITGASSGIGRASGLRFAGEGAAVALTARSKEKLEVVAELIRQGGGEAEAFSADLTRPEEIETLVEAVAARFGGIDVLVNAAGIIRSGTIETTTLSEWKTMMDINVQAPFLLMHLTLPYLIERKGNVVNVSSVNGIRAFPGVLAYCTSKSALDQLSHCAALELAAKGVRVNTVNPGVTRTNLHRSGGMDEDGYAAFLEHSKTTHPLGRVGQPEEVAELIFFLASPRAGWITGISAPIDGGRSQTCAR